jgi:hypothetical protein
MQRVAHAFSLHRVGAAIFLAALAVYAGIYLTSGDPDPGPADGHYQFLYARSMAFDGDLDFRNDYAICGDPYRQGVDRGTGRLDNPGYAGPSLVWTPLLAAARAVVPLSQETSVAVRSGCHGRLARIALAAALPLGALAIALSYGAARRIAGPAAAAIAALLMAFASSLSLYASVFVSSSHVFECVFAALCVWSSLRAAGGDWRAGRWLLVGLSLFALTLQRVSDASFVLLPLALMTGAPISRRQKWSAAGLSIAGAAFGLAIVAALYTYLYGSPWVLPQGRHFLHLTHAHPFLLLFAPQGGLFYATPSVYLAFAGLALGLADDRYRRLAIASAAIAAICIWIAASPLDWHGKATFGARRLVVLTPLFVMFAALTLHVLLERVPRRGERLAVVASGAFALLLALPVLGSVMDITNGRTPLEAAPLHVRQAGWPYRAVAALGNVAVLPARIVYAARFGMPLDSFGHATTDLFYRRSYRDLGWEPQTLDFTSEALRAASRGMEPRATGLALLSADAAVVFTAGWPFADSARVSLKTEAPGSLEVSLGTAFGRCALGTRPIRKGPNVVTFAIPDGCFDSGLVEIVFRAPPASGVVVERLTLDDSRVLPPPI